MLPDYEKLGTFYLGKEKDSGRLLLYDSKDLVTHAVCVGMTGSGKTGLCIGLLEEAAIDGIPSIVIDPKGDLSNLLLTFPDLSAEEFAPWVNPDDARTAGLDVNAFAATQADSWKTGLAQWQQDGARIQRLRDAADFAIYTPGSDAGLPVSILKSFAAPPAAIMAERELYRDRITATASSLLGLIGIAGDPLQSREHVLLSNILDKAWTAGQDLDLPGLIGQIQNPPFTTVGVMDVNAFYPEKDRFQLVMSLNNLLASPGFEMWMQGDALDIGQLLFSPKSKPRVVIFSISHLSDAERMFFVSLLLNQTLGWVRSQSGTTSLRALLYMDEIWLLPAGCESTVEKAAADTAETGACVRLWSGSGDAESSRYRLQGIVEHRHVVHWTATDRTRQDEGVGWLGRRLRRHGFDVRPGVDGYAAFRLSAARVPDE